MWFHPEGRESVLSYDGTSLVGTRQTAERFSLPYLEDRNLFSIATTIQKRRKILLPLLAKVRSAYQDEVPSSSVDRATQVFAAR